MVSAAVRPHVYWVGEEAGSRESVRGWPVGRALLETLAHLNSDVGETLADERARLRHCGYADDLPLPALWWRGTVEATELTAA